MSIDVVKTIKVHAWGKGQGDFVEINESDFDPTKHKKYNAKDAPAPVAVAPPPPVSVVELPEPKATTKAVELANEAGIDLSTIAGTGNNGKITLEDVEAAIEKLTAPESDNK